MQPDVLSLLAHQGEGVEHGLDVLDGHEAHNRPDVHPAVRLLLRNDLELVEGHAVGDHPALVRRTSDVLLDQAGPVEEGGDLLRVPVGTAGIHVEHPDPEVLEVVRHPVRAEDLLLPLPGVDPVLRHEEGLSGPDVGHGAKHPRVARGDGVVEVRLRDFAAQKV